MDTSDKRVEIRQALARGYCSKENEQKVLDPELIEAMALEVEQALTQNNQDMMREVVEEILKMADALEMECGKDGDKGTKQWMAFKGFRNTIRDKYIIKSVTPPSSRM